MNYILFDRLIITEIGDDTTPVHTLIGLTSSRRHGPARMRLCTRTATIEAEPRSLINIDQVVNTTNVTQQDTNHL
jgi:hypothetical protein